MMMEGQIHTDTWVLVPTVIVAFGQCECCEADAVQISLSWFCFSVSVTFGAKGPHE